MGSRNGVGPLISEGSPRIRAHPLAGSDVGNRVSACIRTIAKSKPELDGRSTEVHVRARWA